MNEAAAANTPPKPDLLDRLKPVVILTVSVKPWGDGMTVTAEAVVDRKATPDLSGPALALLQKVEKVLGASHQSCTEANELQEGGQGA